MNFWTDFKQALSKTPRALLRRERWWSFGQTWGSEDPLHDQSSRLQRSPGPGCINEQAALKGTGSCNADEWSLQSRDERREGAGSTGGGWQPWRKGLICTLDFCKLICHVGGVTTLPSAFVAPTWLTPAFFLSTYHRPVLGSNPELHVAFAGRICFWKFQWILITFHHWRGCVHRLEPRWRSWVQRSGEGGDIYAYKKLQPIESPLISIIDSINSHSPRARFGSLLMPECGEMNVLAKQKRKNHY